MGSHHPKNPRTGFTTKELEALPASAHGHNLPDGGNLVGRAYHDTRGRTTIGWRQGVKVNGSLVWVSVGKWPEDGMGEIRSRARAIKLDARQGIDPRLVQEAAAIERKNEVQAIIDNEAETINKRKTVQDLFDTWVDIGVARSDGNAEIKSQFDRHVLPAIGHIEVSALTDADLVRIYRGRVEAGNDATAISLSNLIGQMLRWAEKRNPWRALMQEQGNPAALVDVTKLVNKDYVGERDRVLSDSEIKRLWEAFESVQATHDAAPNKYAVERPLPVTTQAAVWICLATLCRIGELLQTEWSHLDLDAGTWTIPSELVKGRGKKKQPHHVTLSTFALSQFKRIQAVTGASRWVFPNTDGTDHIDTKSAAKAIADRQVKFHDRSDLSRRVSTNSLALDDRWTPHDLRRTGATIMQRLGVSLDVIDRCQNHLIAGSKVRRHYMHHDYANEKALAWAKLGDELTRIIGGN